MNQYKKHILQVTIVALMLNSAMPAQAIDWSYWSNCARDTISGFATSVPSKSQVIDRLKQPKIWGALAVVSVVAVVGLYYMNSKQQPKQPLKSNDGAKGQHPKQPTQQPKQASLEVEGITKNAQALLSKRYTLNRVESAWNLGGAAIWKISEPAFNILAQKYRDEDLVKILDDKYERIKIFDDENLTPKALKENKSYIKLFCNLKSVNLERLNTYISKLGRCIKCHMPFGNLNDMHTRLQGQLKQRFEQMRAFRDIVVEAQQSDNGSSRGKEEVALKLATAGFLTGVEEEKEACSKQVGSPHIESDEHALGEPSNSFVEDPKKEEAACVSEGEQQEVVAYAHYNPSFSYTSNESVQS